MGISRLSALTTAAVVTILGITVGVSGTDGADDTDGRTVFLHVRHSRFQPDSITVMPGAKIRFVVVNEDPIDHELIIGNAEVHRQHEVGRQAHHHGDVPGEVTVAAGQRAATTFRFPHRKASVVFGCHLPGHWDYGMKGLARVR